MSKSTHPHLDGANAHHKAASPARKFDIDALPWSIINTLMAGCLILFAPATWVIWAVGIASIFVAAVSGAAVARSRTSSLRSLTPFDFLIVWLPGLAGLGLALLGFALIVRNPDDQLLRMGGFGLFLFQILLIAITTVTTSASADRGSTDRQR